MHYWLMKSEPDEVSFDDVLAAPARTVAWFGVRNYQARNFMRDQMAPGDGVLFYHSSCAEPGVAGIAEVASAAYPDESQFEAGGKYFDPKATRETPRWISVDVHAVEQGRYLPLVRNAHHAGTRRHGAAAKRQPPVDFAGHRRPVESDPGIRAREGRRLPVTRHFAIDRSTPQSPGWPVVLHRWEARARIRGRFA